jgi:ATP-dependent DNA helicase RecG
MLDSIANRNAIDLLLLDKLPDILNNTQKKNKITNLLTALRVEQKILNTGNDRKSKWVLKEL